MKITTLILELLSLLTGFFVASYMLRKKNNSPRKKVTKKDFFTMTKSLGAAFGGPLLSAYLCLLGAVNIKRVVFFALLSWGLTVIFCIFIKKNISKSLQKRNVTGIEPYVLYFSLIIPSTSLYLMFLFSYSFWLK